MGLNNSKLPILLLNLKEEVGLPFLIFVDSSSPFAIIDATMAAFWERARKH